MRIRRYGRTLSIVTGRLGIPWGLHVWIRLLPRWIFFGISVSRDEEDENLEIVVGLVVLSISASPMHYLTRKARARRLDELADHLGPRLVDEVEDHLRGST